MQTLETISFFGEHGYMRRRLFFGLAHVACRGNHRPPFPFPEALVGRTTTRSPFRSSFDSTRRPPPDSPLASSSGGVESAIGLSCNEIRIDQPAMEQLKLQIFFYSAILNATSRENLARGMLLFIPAFRPAGTSSGDDRVRHRPFV